MTEPERLVERSAGLEVGAFEAFYRSTRAGTLAVVLALRGPRVGAEEVVQEAFLRRAERAHGTTWRLVVVFAGTVMLTAATRSRADKPWDVPWGSRGEIAGRGRQ